MQTVTETALDRSVEDVFTREQAALWVQDRSSRLDALLKRAVATGEIWRIRRGLYCLARRYSRGGINPFKLAQRIHGPSYISLETALSYHGWIPEAVRAITSASCERSRTFESPVALFTFTRIPQRLFFAGVRRIAEEGNNGVFLATPLKALADYVYVHKCDWLSTSPVMESLRVEEEALGDLRAEQFCEVMSAYRQGRVLRFLAALRKELKR